MKVRALRIVVLGLSITSSWGNGHATTYRGLIRALAARGHDVLFLERDMPWYAASRDLTDPPWCRTALYSSLKDLKERFRSEVRDADLVIVGSYVPEGVAVGEWVVATASGITAFYDIDTPVTLARLDQGDRAYLSPGLVAVYHLYLSFTGGPTLERIARDYGAPMVRPLYCSVDHTAYYPEPHEQHWDLGYMGTYSDDRQPALERLLLEPARKWRQGRFVVAGAQYPGNIDWPGNVERIDHLAPGRHRGFYNAQRFTLNVTRARMVDSGFSPSVRLFEAAACGVPIISDPWPGLDTLFIPGREILIARTADEVRQYLVDLPEWERKAVGLRGRHRVLARHTAAHRAAQLESYVVELLGPSVLELPLRAMGARAG